MSRRGKREWNGGVRRRDNVNFDRPLSRRGQPSGLPPALPLVHVTAAWPAGEIVRDGKLQTRRCDVFDAELLYFFVLRPAYRSKFGTEESHQLSRFPVVFVLRPEAVRAPRHVYPFDTGGAAKGAFASKADRFVPLEDYALEPPSHASAIGHIGWAFGTLEDYFVGRLRPDIDAEVQPSEFAVSGFLDIARMGFDGSNEHDKRACTIEVAAGHDVDLKDNVHLVILPKQFLEGNTELFDRLTALGVEIVWYDWQPNRAPDEFQKDIMDIARAWYRDQGIMP